jgi:hypothetical protein
MSYVSIQEFKQAPTGIDYSTLDNTAIGDPEAQDNALQSILDKASDWVNTICKVSTLEAVSVTETKRLKLNRDHSLSIQVTNTPILSIESIQYRIKPTDAWKTVDVSSIDTFDYYFNVYDLPHSYRQETVYTVQFSYTAGYTEIPEVVKQATILLATYLVRERGQVAITMNNTSLGVSSNTVPNDVETAKALLNNVSRSVIV